MSLESFLRNSIFVISLFSSPILGQLQFGGGSSSSKSPSSPGKNDTDNRFFFDGPGGLPSTGNEALDGGIIGLGVRDVVAQIKHSTVLKKISNFKDDDDISF